MRRRRREAASFEIGDAGSKMKNVTIEDNFSTNPGPAVRVRGSLLDRIMLRRNRHEPRTSARGWRRVLYDLAVGIIVALAAAAVLALLALAF